MTLCTYCGKDPMTPEGDAMARSMDIHLVDEHPESPEYVAWRQRMDEENARVEALHNSPAYKAQVAREQAAWDALQPMKLLPLYHGTERVLEEGDLILPWSKKIAHASASYYTARVFAGGPKGLKAGTGRVYEVEMIAAEESWVQQMKYTGNEVHHEVVSTAGFRVKRLLPQSYRQ